MILIAGLIAGFVALAAIPAAAEAREDAPKEVPQEIADYVQHLRDILRLSDEQASQIRVFLLEAYGYSDKMRQTREKIQSVLSADQKEVYDRWERELRWREEQEERSRILRSTSAGRSRSSN